MSVPQSSLELQNKPQVSSNGKFKNSQNDVMYSQEEYKLLNFLSIFSVMENRIPCRLDEDDYNVPKWKQILHESTMAQKERKTNAIKQILMEIIDRI